MPTQPTRKKETLGELITEATKPTPRLTQAELANASGLTPWHLTKIVNNYNAHLTSDQLTRLAQGLGVSMKRATRALEASKQALSSAPVSHKNHKWLAASGMGKKL